MSDLNEWSELAKDETIGIEDLDVALQAYADARYDYEEKKKISNEADAVAKEAKRKLISLLTASGKKNWEVEGIGKASVTVKYSVKTPKDLDSKQKMLDFFKSLGEDTFLSVVGVNHQTLNAFYNQETENNPEFTMPGVEAPVAEENIRFTKGRK